MDGDLDPQRFPRLVELQAALGSGLLLRTTPDPELSALAARILQQEPDKRTVEEWAGDLANDLAQFTD